MEPGETSALIMIEVMQDNKPEEAEIFHVNLTNVEKFPTDTSPSISPRLSYLYQSSVVTIKESNDPYGILCLEQITAVEERFQQVNLTVRRTGGIFGTVRVLVRTVGGGEDWTSQIVPKPGADSNNTITEILGNRDPLASADGRTDYVILNTEIEFKQGETTKTVQLTVLADDMAEPDETVLVYLTQPTGGARIAAGEPDGGKKGYAVVYISQNDLSNGKIGFSEDSKQVSANEDLSPTFALKLARTEAFFGEVEISWVAKVGETSTEVEDVVLSSQLERTAGTAICPRRHANCFFNISLVNDEIPEEESSFVVKLVSVENDAQLNEASLFAHITVASSDYIRGLIEFTDDSSIVVVSRYAESVRLKVSRRGGQEYRVEASYRTSQMVSQDARAGITLYPALEGEDYSGRTGTLVFEAERQDLQYIDVNLTPTRASTNPYPKQFYVELRNPSNGALINTENYRAAVMVVQDVDIWNIIINKGDKPLTDDEIRDIIAELDALIQTSRPMTDNEVTLVENILKDIIDEGLNRKLPTQIISQVINVMCKMLTPNKDDATRGRFTLAEIMENIAYMMVAETPCPSPNPPDLLSLQCVHAKVAAGRWPLGNIQGFQYAAQHQDNLRVPNKIPNAPVTGETQCLDFHIIEYMSEQWFQQGAQNVLLSNKVLSFGVKDRPSSYTDVPMKFRINSPDRRIATRKAQCVYFDIALRSWVGPKEVCEVTNNLDLGVDSFVDCSCKHLTHYAVQAVTSDAGIVGYTIWFYIACFICMAGLILAILAHHACSISAMVSSSLLMHMCFAALATQICYVVAAYVSPDEILVYTLDDDNYRCIVMGLFLHYFFLAQFSWMMTQAVNFWKILVLNDEHTDRKYVLFFLLGWGVPVVILAIFYVVTFNLYKYVYDLPTDFIYGDVNNNGDLCFITNAYAALAGVIIPVLLMFTVVAVVFVKAFQVTPQWQAYDDIYRGRYNIKEVRTILMFWAVIILTWLWGSLHLVYGHLWMLIMFCIFNIIQGIMALVLYALLRNPCLMQCFAPQKASSYAVTAGLFEPTHLPHQHGSNAGQYQFHPSTLDAGSLKGSRASLLNESWERDSLPTSRPSTMKVKRTLPHSGNIYIDPPVLRQGAESDTKDFDDLLFALKTGRSFTPSDGNSLDSDKLSDISSKVDKYELRRIDIADTHL